MNLLSKEEAEIFLDIDSGTGGDFLDAIISDVSAMIAVATGRIDWGPSEERTEYHDGGQFFILPNYFPITSVTAIYADNDYEWGDDTLVDADDYRGDAKGFIWKDWGHFTSGPEAIKITYTGGYANTAAIPEQIKVAARRQVEYEYNVRKRVGNVSEGATSGAVLAEIHPLLINYRREVPFSDGGN